VGRRVLARGIGDALDAFAADGDKHTVLDAAQARQRLLALDGIVDLEHRGGGELVALGYEGIVGFELVHDLRLAAALDVKHLMDLMPHGVGVLEIEGAERPDLDAAVAFDLADAAAMVTPLAGVLLDRQNVGARQALSCRHGGPYGVSP